MTIEAVSVLFDTGRKGDALAASRQFGHGKGDKDDGMDENDDDAVKQPNSKVVSHIP